MYVNEAAVDADGEGLDVLPDANIKFSSKHWTRLGRGEGQEAGQKGIQEDGNMIVSRSKTFQDIFANTGSVSVRYLL